MAGAVAFPHAAAMSVLLLADGEAVGEDDVLAEGLGVGLGVGVAVPEVRRGEMDR